MSWIFALSGADLTVAISPMPLVLSHSVSHSVLNFYRRGCRTLLLLLVWGGYRLQRFEAPPAQKAVKLPAPAFQRPRNPGRELRTSQEAELAQCFMYWTSSKITEVTIFSVPLFLIQPLAALYLGRITIVLSLAHRLENSESLPGPDLGIRNLLGAA